MSAALIQFVWQGAVVALLLMIVQFVLRGRSAQSRYLAGCVALAIMAILPVVTAFLLYRRPDAGTSLSATDWALPSWAVGVGIFSLRPLWSLTSIYALRRCGTAPDAWISELGLSVAKRTGLTRAFRILISAISETPAVIGWLRPVILLPAAAVAGLTVEQLETVLAHEIAHIRRYDYLVNLLQVLVETLLFYHPAVWWVSSRIRAERELCCDDEVVRFAGDALCYAWALTTLERLRSATPTLAMGSAGGELSYRIRRLVGDAPPQRERWPAILAAALALLCATACARFARSPQPDDAVTVEVTRDPAGAIIGVRKVSGPGYLAPAALQAALQLSNGISSTLSDGRTQGVHISELKPEGRVQLVTFPAAFRGPRDQAATLKNFFADVLVQAEKDVQTAPDEKSRTAAREKLTKLQRSQAMTRANDVLVQRPEKLWNIQVIRHQLEVLKQHLGKLRAGSNPELEAQYEQNLEALVAAERALVQP